MLFAAAPPLTRVDRIRIASAALVLLLGASTASAQTESQGEARVHVRFRTDDAARPTVFARVDDRWARVCLAPCERDLAPGSYAFALSLDRADPVRVPSAIELRAPTVDLAAHFEDGNALRVGVGLLIGGALSWATAGSMVPIILMEDLTGTIAAASFVIGLIGIAVGLVLVVTGIVLATGGGPRAELVPAP